MLKISRLSFVSSKPTAVTLISCFSISNPAIIFNSFSAGTDFTEVLKLLSTYTLKILLVAPLWVPVFEKNMFEKKKV